MSRKTSGPHHGWNDVIGVILLVAAVLLLVSQWSFDRNDIAFLHFPPNKPVSNWIGSWGAHIAYSTFFIFGLAAFLVPFLIGAFGCSFILNIWPYLRERRVHLSIWSLVFLFSFSGLLDRTGTLLKALWSNIGAQAGGGWLGSTLFDFKLFGDDWGFWVFGGVGATIVYAAVCLISLLFLTNFHLGNWIRALLATSVGAPGQKSPTSPAETKSPQEAALERRARELEKQAKQLQEQVARSGLGADMQPVPEPTVRDLSVPQAKGPRIRKTTMPDAAKTIEPADEGQVIPAKEVAAATTDEILGKKAGDKPAA